MKACLISSTSSVLSWQIRKRELPLKDMLIDFWQAGGDLN